MLSIFKTKTLNQNVLPETKEAIFDLDFDRSKEFKFDYLSFSDWYKIVQYIINYDMILAKLEKLDDLLLKEKQLKFFLECRGIIPEDNKLLLNTLNQKYDEMLRIRSEIKLNKSTLTDKIMDEKRAQLIESEISQQITNQEKVKKAQNYDLCFRNPYFIKGDDQKFELRYKCLKIEIKMIKSNIQQIKPYKKKYLRNLKQFENQVSIILKINQEQFKTLFDFTRPHISDIIKSSDFLYQDLISISLLE